jgi:hypothetical protein
VARSTKRQLESRLAVLVGHLLKWHIQSGGRSRSWRATISTQRKCLDRLLRKTPSLHHLLDNEQWLDRIWEEARANAVNDTGLGFPDDWIWSLEQVLDESVFPD